MGRSSMMGGDVLGWCGRLGEASGVGALGPVAGGGEELS